MCEDSSAAQALNGTKAVSEFLSLLLKNENRVPGR